MDSFAVLMHPFNTLVNPPLCIAAIDAKNKAGIEKKCPLQIRNINSPNVWILTSAPAVVSTGVMIICPDEAPRIFKTQTPIHILSYHQHAVLPLSTFIYHPTIKLIS